VDILSQFLNCKTIDVGKQSKLNPDTFLPFFYLQIMGKNFRQTQDFCV
jgi:hypothetical protein